MKWGVVLANRGRLATTDLDYERTRCEARLNRLNVWSNGPAGAKDGINSRVSHLSAPKLAAAPFQHGELSVLPVVCTGVLPTQYCARRV